MISLASILIGLVMALYAPVAEAGPLCKGAPDEYIIEAIQGQVVDRDTGQPIEGAIILATWATTGPRQILRLTESVTDSNGVFSFPGWGPIKKPEGKCFWSEDPFLIFFKPGYYVWGLHNSYLLERTGSPEENLANPVPSRIRKSRYHGKTIKLPKFVIGSEVERFSASAGKVIKEILTEQDWCSQIHNAHVRREFWPEVPHFLDVLKEQKRLHPDCSFMAPLPHEEKR